MQGWPAPMGQLVPSLNMTWGQLLKVLGPLQPTSARHQPFMAPSSPNFLTNSPAS